jgi:NCS2 family nucleobase:cation symporter-2/xanthine permease XanP
MVTLLGLALLGGRTLRLWCPILGLGAGLCAAWALGLMDLAGVAEQPWLGLAVGGQWPGLALELKAEHMSLLATMAVLTVINSIQAIGNSMAVQQVSQRNFRKVDYDSVQGTMYADAVGNLLSGALGTVPNETYCENISVLKVTGVASRVVGVCGGLLLIAVSFSPKVGMSVAQMPDPVFGGFVIGLAAMMFPSGLSLVFSNGITHQSGLLVGISLCLGLLAQTKQFFTDLFPSSVEVFLHNGVATGGLAAFVLSTVFYLMPKRGLYFRLEASLEHLPHLIREVERAAERMKVPSEVLFNLELACEEVFAHLVGQAKHGPKQGKIAYRIHRDEHEMVVEVMSGDSIDDFHDETMPEDLLACHDEELKHMGLALLHKVATRVRHLEISGVTYLSFVMPLPEPARG